jgi:hypothetical protein
MRLTQTPDVLHDVEKIGDFSEKTVKKSSLHMKGN